MDSIEAHTEAICLSHHATDTAAKIPTAPKQKALIMLVAINRCCWYFTVFADVCLDEKWWNEVRG